MEKWNRRHCLSEQKYTLPVPRRWFPAPLNLLHQSGSNLKSGPASMAEPAPSYLFLIFLEVVDGKLQDFVPRQTF